MGAGAAQKKSGDLILEADELWSFVGSKGDVWWVWAALDADTRQVVAMVCGDRSEATAQCLWDALPDEYREGAIICTDFWSAYQAVIPEDRHAAAGKDAGLTNHVERFWCTLRQRCGRFVRKTLSFSKCVENHVGALWYFVRRYNQSRA
jgi:insertion element IS1 protein InsB